MNVCFIGASGHSVSVAGSLKKDKSINVVGIAPGSDGEDVDKLHDLLCSLGYTPKRYDDYNEMLESLRPDIAVVDCYFCDHAKVGIDALQMGCNVFIEKPVATTLEDLELLKNAYRDSGKHLAAMLNMRYTAPFLTAWTAVRDGAIGEVRLLNGQKSYKLGSRGDLYRDRRLYGGTIPWVGVHAVDWVHWFSNQRFESVFATHSDKFNSGHGDLEVSALCLFTMSGEVCASVSIDYLRPDKAPTHGDDRIRVVGTKGVIEVKDGVVDLINNSVPGVQRLELLPGGNIFIDFVKQVRGEGKCMLSAEESFYSTEACLRARISADEKRVVIF
jgi:predicted dehydrogenase